MKDKEEKDSDSVWIKLKRHLVTEFHLIKGIEDSLDHCDRCMTMVISSKLSCRPHSKESAITTAGCIRS